VTPSTLLAADGLALAVEHHRLEAPRARVVIVHGYAEHKGRYRHVVAALAAAGYECHLLDLRGHGDSGGRRGHVSRFAEYRDDLDRFAAAVQERGGAPAPLILLGHSLGGLASLDFVIHRPEAFDALAVSSPFLQPGFKIPFYKRMIAPVAARLAPALAVPSGIDPRWLSHDPEVVRAYAADPLVFPTSTPGWLAAVQETQEEVFARAGEIRLPVLLLLGSADPIAAPQRGRALFERLASPDKRLVVYEGLLHEVFNEVERDRVIGDLLAWLQEKTSLRTDD
jgi:alpha-beta hydrolase superfamily lysophospholipase